MTEALPGFSSKSASHINLQDGCGGGIIFIPDVDLIDAVIDTTALADDWLNELFEAIKEKLTRSLALATKKEYRSEFEEHHIAAKKSVNARRAAAILNEVLPGGVEDPLNKVMLKTSVHRRIHTSLYYLLVNETIIAAYTQANGDKQKQYSNVVAVLGTLKTFLETLNAFSIN